MPGSFILIQSQYFPIKIEETSLSIYNLFTSLLLSLHPTYTGVIKAPPDHRDVEATLLFRQSPQLNTAGQGEAGASHHLLAHRLSREKQHVRLNVEPCDTEINTVKHQRKDLPKFPIKCLVLAP